MSDWKETYLSALSVRDSAEKSNEKIYAAYTKLANRTAQLSQNQQKSAESQTPPETLPPPPPSLLSRYASRSPPPLPALDTPTMVSLRRELSTAQSTRALLTTELATTLSTLSALQEQQQTGTAQISQLRSTTTQLQLRLRDLTEELRAKAKLLTDVQDENATLNLQLNVADEQAKNLKKENQELVDRWMKRKGEEAERMNSEGLFG